MSAPAITAYRAVVPFVTKDGSIIRELMHPQVHGNRMQSLAEAIVPPQSRTLLHRHHLSEELYHVTGGSGRMRLGEHEFPVTVGDTVCIAPGTPHALITPGGRAARVPRRPTGTTGENAFTAATKAPMRKGRSPGAGPKVPSGKNTSEAPSRTRVSRACAAAALCWMSKRSTNSQP